MPYVDDESKSCFNFERGPDNFTHETQECMQKEGYVCEYNNNAPSFRLYQDVNVMETVGKYTHTHELFGADTQFFLNISSTSSCSIRNSLC